MPSSSSASTSSHLFETSRASTTGSSSPPTLAGILPDGREHLRLPSLKASLVHLPLHLPPAPEPLPEPSRSLVLNDDLQGAPLGFVVHKMRSLGPQLLKTTSGTCLFIPPGPALPPYIRCGVPRLPSDVATIGRPSHILAIHSPDSPRTLLLPVHGLLFAACCPPLAILSSSVEKQPAHPSLPRSEFRPILDQHALSQGHLDLPVVELNVPSSSAFPLVQGWIYLRSPSLLLSSLFPRSPTVPTRPNPSEASSLSRLLNPPLAPEWREAPDSPEALTISLSNLASSELLKHIHRVHDLWGVVVCLQLSDEELWKTMRLAWKILVAALALKERQRMSRTTEAGDA
ncbi:uncharacterized protein JCM15063_002502 [Sporobolomyces koalae]|uniref:uncharacterized protein n=1 Tax=Sporobolomyces koalae TaxID=500713 RepID=UPI0031802D37